ncbi:MAG: hypothetical protein HWE15_12145 [Algoriphagus sp.]|uniref:hypothetical protein n=1 Tax=Algoriphagus sp. TaxID=1872435 RepID=UPI0017B6C82F|nr:hypothetical protein [Algoriphagus sp.]NVJ87052.1 hypothetical protein [Algoriphagus sp.]
MRLGCFLFLFLGLIFSSYSQTDPLTQVHGAQYHGLGNMRVHLPSTWSYFNNIGALDQIEEAGIVAGFDHRFGLAELSTFDLAGSFKSNNGTIGFGISRFGGKLFNQQTIGIGYSNTLGISSIGVKLEYFQTQIQDFGSAGSLIFSLGGITELSSNLYLGAIITNINRAKIGAESNTHLPTFVQVGIHYLPSDNISFLLEFEKDIQVDPILKIGLEYRLRDWTSLRTGINSNPSRLFAGLSIIQKKFSFDYAYGNTAPLGATHHLSLNYLWGK